MSDEIAELTELMESYRRRSRAVALRPIAAAYADAADELEELIKLRAVRPPGGIVHTGSSAAELPRV